MMRIITGTSRGTRLESLPGDDTRPTSERVKEAIFSSLQFEVQGRRVLDLFAGSGQMGLEALSRGAESCMFIDASREAMAYIKKNAEKTRLFDRSKFLVSDFRTYIGKATGQFDLVFIDPPYALGVAGDAVRRLIEKDLLAPNAIIVAESGNEDIFGGDVPKGIQVMKSARYSISYVNILRYEGENK